MNSALHPSLTQTELRLDVTPHELSLVHGLVASRCLRLLGHQTTILHCPTLGHLPTACHWREHLRISFLDFLLSVHDGAKNKMDSWQSTIQPCLETMNLQTPLIPTIFRDDFIPLSAWDRKLLAFCKITPNKQPKQTQTLIQLDHQHRTLRWSSGKTNKSIDLSQHPISWRLLSILAGPSGRHISKQFIHEQLTASKYNSDIHDNRLHQLIRRLAQKLSAQHCPKLWILPGDHSVRLLQNIEVIYDHT